MARNETEQVRQLQRTLYRTAKQSKAVKFYSLYDKVWRIDVLREAWRQSKPIRVRRAWIGKPSKALCRAEKKRRCSVECSNNCVPGSIAFNRCDEWISRNPREALGHWESRQFRIASSKLR